MEMNSVDVHVGAVLRDARRARDLYEEAAAEAVGVDADTLRAIEDGRQHASAGQLQAFCRLYALAPADLYRGMPLFADDAPPRSASFAART